MVFDGEFKTLSSEGNNMLCIDFIESSDVQPYDESSRLHAWRIRCARLR
jgi:hypothetical protein